MNENNCCSHFTVKQLVLMKTALHLAREHLPWMEVEMTISDINDLLQFEAERKRERRKSLRIERKAASATRQRQSGSVE